MEPTKSFLAGCALIGVGLIGENTAWGNPDLRATVVGKWQWQERQYYTFAADQTGSMSQDGRIFSFRWQVAGEDVAITFVDGEGQALFTWNASADPNPLFLRIQTMPGRPAVQIKRVPKIHFRPGLAAGT